MSLFENKYRKFKPTHHEFITWLTFANAGMLQDGNIGSMEYAIKNLPTGNPVIEIGSFCGLSLNVMSFYLRTEKKINKLFSCDKWMFEGAENPESKIVESDLTHRAYKEYARASFIRNVNLFSAERMDSISTIEVFSDEFFKMWNDKLTVTDVFGKQAKLGGNISFAYIDGNHTYEFAKRDFVNVDKWLDVGGFILFDDSSRRSKFEVYKVISEIMKRPDYEIIINNPNYLVRKIK
jgi:hypothetical protein